MRNFQLKLGLWALVFVGQVVWARDVSFTQQSLLDPYEVTACSFSKSEVGSYEYDVHCGEKKYAVHLVLSFYPKTIHGTAAYELLYWVTDFTDPKNPVSDSTTLWVHNSNPENKMTVLEAAQGVQNDTAQLKLFMKLQ